MKQEAEASEKNLDYRKPEVKGDLIWAGSKGFEPSIFSLTRRRVNRYATTPNEVNYTTKKLYDEYK